MKAGYLAVVLDLFSRQVIGWSMRSRIDIKLAIVQWLPTFTSCAVGDSLLIAYCLLPRCLHKVAGTQ
jgi:hypothetical protein